MKILLANKFPMFCTIQNYDMFGNILECPIYIDIDNKKLDTALEDARYAVWMFKDLLDVVPKIYFSGGKGFHIILNYMIKDPQCHFIVRNFVNRISLSLKVDQRVYRPRNMFRLNNSIGSKPGHYKVELSYTELMSKDVAYILNLSTKRREGLTIYPADTEHLEDDKAFTDLLKLATNDLPKFKDLSEIKDQARDMDVDMTPCIEHMLDVGPKKGERNHMVFILAKFFKSCEIPQVNALEVLLLREHFKTFEAEGGEVSKVIGSVYRSEMLPKLGCKAGYDSKLMQKYCDPWCGYSKEELNIRFKKNEVQDANT